MVSYYNAKQMVTHNHGTEGWLDFLIDFGLRTHYNFHRMMEWING